MNILLLSAYDAHSHQAWRTLLVEYFDQWRWTVLTLPPRHFSWRVRGNSLTWFLTEQETLSKPYDLIVATSMVDLSALKGFCPALQGVPTVLYFHENQFAYPKSQQTKHSLLDPQMVSVYAAFVADKLVFNSRYNLDSFHAGVADLLTRLPDGIPRQAEKVLVEKSVVLPVPIKLPAADNNFFEPLHSRHAQPLRVVWNHRWEYDKGPETLLNTVQHLPASLPIQFHILGQQFRQRPPAMDELKALLIQRNWLGQWGFIESKTDYKQILRLSDVVLSTAWHDFQGLAILEAVAEGCVPLVPNRLVYPEIFSQTYVFDGENEAHALAAQLSDWARRKMEQALPRVPNVDVFGIERLGDKYKNLFNEMIAHH